MKNRKNLPDGLLRLRLFRLRLRGRLSLSAAAVLIDHYLTGVFPEAKLYKNLVRELW